MIGQHYIVTGGTSGLGLEIVKQLLEKGVFVTVIARNESKFNDIDFGSYQSKVTMVHCDLQNREAIANITSTIKYPINGLIYSSGLGYFKSVTHHSTEEMIETYDVNLISFNLLYNVLRPYFSKMHQSLVFQVRPLLLHKPMLHIMALLKLLLMRF